ncbi:MAG: hypothetical protein ACT4OO_07005 [Nitrospiraceae bacterium]
MSTSSPPRPSLKSWVCSVAIGVLLLTCGCTKQYIPELILPSADKTIDAVVEFHPLRMAPGIRSGHDTYGVEGPKVETASPTDLTDQISTAMLSGLADSGLFSHITAFDPQPDLILSGRIDKFYEHYRQKLWTYAPYAETVAGLLRINTYVSTGEVNLTMTVLKATGEVIGRYPSRVTFQEDFKPNSEMPPGERLNHALAEAVQEIRDKLVADPRLAQFTPSKTLSSQ